MALAGFRVIKGQFHIRGFKPDGDSVRFSAERKDLFVGLHREYKSLSTTGDFQLRLEGIDAPETHYGLECQPFGVLARDRLLSLLGFTAIHHLEEKVVGCEPELVPGAVLTRGFDPHGRPISYALLGEQPELADGSDLMVGVDLLARTLNAQMIQQGFAYPLLYTSTPATHRAWLRAQAFEARERKLGVWAADSSREFKLLDRTSICASTGTLIFPKFFRRSIDYLRQTISGQFRGDFAAWLAATPSENDMVVINRLEVPLSQLFQQRNSKITCQAELLDMVFVEK